MTFLLDTNVVSELRKQDDRINPGVSAWADSVAGHLLYISVVSVMEIEIGVGRLERRDPKQAKVFGEWLMGHVLPEFNRRILPVDLPVARRAAAFHVPDPRPERDTWIAATADVHGLTVVSRNSKDFEALGVAVLNPWV